MSFLAPFFLAGAAAIGLPILFHLIRRTNRERQVFSSLMFLSPSPPRLTKRSRLEHILLLALRCGVVLLLATGFARPFLKKPVASPAVANASKRILVLVDESASMRREGVWQRAMSEVKSALQAAGPNDEAAIYVASKALSPVLTFEDWSKAAPGERAGLATAALSALRPTWHAGQTGPLLISAVEILADAQGQSAERARHIVLVSDMQESGRWSALQGYTWPKGATFEARVVKPTHSSNASLQLLTDAGREEIKDASRPAGARVRISNSPESQTDQFKVVWAGARGPVGAPYDLQVAPGHSRTITLPFTDADSPADRIQLTGDSEPYDNIVFAVSPPPARFQVLYLGKDDGTNSREPLYFLRRAFQETRSHQIRVISRSANKDFGSHDYAGSTLAIITSSVSASELTALREFAKAGKALFLTVADDESAATLASLIEASDLNTKFSPANSFAMMVDLDYTHPLLATFANPRFADFTRVKFWRHAVLDAGRLPEAKVLAKFDTGGPALMEMPLGKGRVFALASSWRPADSQLALSTKFVPLLYTLLEQSGAELSQPQQLFVGDTLPLRKIEAGTTVSLTNGGGARVFLDAAQLSRPVSEPGIYTIKGGESVAQYAVNLDPAESRAQTVSTDELEKMGAPLRVTAPAAQQAKLTAEVRLAQAELESRQQLWRWLIGAAVVFVLAETWLSGRAARRVGAAIAGV